MHKQSQSCLYKVTLEKHWEDTLHKYMINEESKEVCALTRDKHAFT